MHLFAAGFNLRNAVIELGDKFLSPTSPDWAQEVLAAVGSTPPEEVLKKLWKLPKP